MQQRTSIDGIAPGLRISPSGQALCVDWDAAMQTDPANGLPFLQPAFIDQAAREVFLTHNMIRELITFAPRVANNENLLAFFWYCRFRILNDSTLTESWEAPWPALDDYLGEDAGLLNVLVMLSTVPQMLEVYRRLDIPADIYRDTISDLRLWMETDYYHHRYQRWGITPWIARWLCHHWQGQILRLGRLQFSLSQFSGRLRAYRHRQTGEVLAIAEDGICYGSDGNTWRECCGVDPGAWTSTLEITVDAVTGNPISPDGFAHRTTHSLSLTEWDLVLAPGDPVLTFHVPAGVPLTFDDCGESFRSALEVFPHYFPDFKFRGFFTSTWLMDSRLQTLLPAESNIVRLQREVYLYPGLQGDNNQVYERVFGWGTNDINKVDWKTSLQKTIGAYLNNGGHFHGGYCFLLIDDFNWDEQIYWRRLADKQQVIVR
jgi:hypothetical protein